MESGGTKDIDFDELDRAVHSLITNAPAPAADKDVEKTVTLQSVDSPNEPTPLVTPPVVPTNPLAARRSTGRFMDVVHPSSDMRTPSPVGGRISRQGATMTPVSRPTSVSTPEPVQNTPAVSTPPVEAPTDSTTDWPDPLDFGSYKPSEQTDELQQSPDKAVTAQDSDAATVPDSLVQTEPHAPQEADEDEDINKISDDISHSLEEGLESPQTSPFLTNTKVEKRPLDAYSTEPVAASIEPSQGVVAQEPVSVPEVNVPNILPPALSNPPEDDPQTPLESAPLPAELQSDLLSIESGGEDGESQSQLQPQPQVQTASALPQDAHEVTGPTSINQQYKESPSTGDQKNGNIFDTSNYHQALAHPAKKKSGWTWVLWIIALLIVGAGAGAAVYFYVLPQL